MNNTIDKQINELETLQADLIANPNLVSVLTTTSVFDDFLALQKLQKAINTTWDTIQALMEANDIKKIDGDWGYITLAERKLFVATGELPPRFYKRMLDSAKIKAHETMTGKLPENVATKSTLYLSKRIK